MTGKGSGLKDRVSPAARLAMRLAMNRLSKLSYQKPQTLRYSSHARAAIKKAGVLTNSQTCLTLASEYRTIQRNTFGTNGDPGTEERPDVAGESTPMSQEDYLSTLARSLGASHYY